MDKWLHLVVSFLSISTDAFVWISFFKTRSRPQRLEKKFFAFAHHLSSKNRFYNVLVIFYPNFQSLRLTLLNASALIAVRVLSINIASHQNLHARWMLLTNNFAVRWRGKVKCHEWAKILISLSDDFPVYQRKNRIYDRITLNRISTCIDLWLTGSSYCLLEEKQTCIFLTVSCGRPTGKMHTVH